MRAVVVESTISLDGYVAPPEGMPARHAGPEDPRLKERKLARMTRAGTHIMGRVTFEEMSTHWPFSDDPYAKPMNDLPKVAFSRTLTDPGDWAHSRIASGDTAQEIQALREQDGGDIVAWGGGAFLQSLSRAGLVDEYRLTINPIVYGGGLPLFDRLPSPIGLELVEADTFPSGTALHIYRPLRA
jgi:dihydrofolate reductase